MAGHRCQPQTDSPTKSSNLNSLLAAALVLYSGNYRYIFVASILPYVIDLINLATYPKELDGELAQTRKDAIGEQLRVTLKTFLGIFKDPLAMRAILNSSGFDSFYKATKEYLQPILKAFALSLPVLAALDDTKRSALIIVMAAGLSTESQFTTIFLAVLSPILGALADWLGIGTALACLGGLMLPLALLFRVNASEAQSGGAQIRA